MMPLGGCMDGESPFLELRTCRTPRCAVAPGAMNEDYVPGGFHDHKLHESNDSYTFLRFPGATAYGRAMRAAEPDGRTRRWEHRRAELLAAATDYVLTHGVATLTLRPLAEALNVTITTLIRQFGSKDQLIEEVCRGIHRTTVHTLANDPELEGLTPTQTLDVLWSRWLDPAQARQFVFLFELFGLALRDPEAYAWFTSSVIADWLKPIEDALVATGKTVDDARVLATVTLALLRGLHMDLAATHDHDRVDAAYRLAAAALAMDL